MDPESVIEQFPRLLPLAVQWAVEQEQRILSEGVELLPAEIADASAVGVHQPQRVRLLRVNVVPRPNNASLRAACDAIHFLTNETRGLTLGYGILIRDDCWRYRPLITHELVHTAQYERFGGIKPFLQQYLTECLTVGYNESPLENEARRVAAAVCVDTHSA